MHVHKMFTYPEGTLPYQQIYYVHTVRLEGTLPYQQIYYVHTVHLDT